MTPTLSATLIFFYDNCLYEVALLLFQFYPSSKTPLAEHVSRDVPFACGSRSLDRSYSHGDSRHRTADVSALLAHGSSTPSAGIGTGRQPRRNGRAGIRLGET